MPLELSSLPVSGLFIKGDEGNYISFSDVKTLDMELIPDTEENDDTKYMDFSSFGEFSFTIHISPRMRRFLLTGKYPSNNWMRMHGFPMERKGRKRWRKKANERNLERHRRMGR